MRRATTVLLQSFRWMITHFLLFRDALWMTWQCEGLVKRVVRFVSRLSLPEPLDGSGRHIVALKS